MKRLVAVLLALASLAAVAAPQMPGRLWTGTKARAMPLAVPLAEVVYRWPATNEKSVTQPDDRVRVVGFVRAAPKDFRPLVWQPSGGGYVARFDIASAGAEGLRVQIDLANAPPLEVRVADATGSVVSMRVKAGDPEAWGPWTEGDVQAVELHSATRPAADAVRLAGILHLDQPLHAKAAGDCTVDVGCSTGNAVLDAAIAERKKSVAHITFVKNGQGYVCTGTLLNSAQHPRPYFLTANHCVGRAATAASITSFWFYENSACGSGPESPDKVQVAGGMGLDFAEPNTDMTLLTMQSDPPDGALFSGWDASRLQTGDPVVNISHPAGDVSKLALATVERMYRFADWGEQELWVTRYTRGVTEGGSSGSGLFTLLEGSLKLRAVLTGGFGSGGTCSNISRRGVYNRFDVFLPEVANFLVATSPVRAPDDHPNTPAEARIVTVGAAPITVAGRIDYQGDVDVIRIPIASAGTLIVRDIGLIDTVGVLLDVNGERVTSNDDAEWNRDNGYGITWRVSPGTYYLVTSRWESAGTGDYSLSLSLSPVTENYTDLWWNREESGWGINLNHQGEILFATLFTYEAGGTPLWLVMAKGDRQPDGTFQGELLRTRGPAFDAKPWTAMTHEVVGTMKLTFLASDLAFLDYTYNGKAIRKTIERQKFVANIVDCAWSAFDRSFASNYQDLWWNPAEPGWGINFAHRGGTIFATLFTYDRDGRGLWLVMSNGVETVDTVANTKTFSGTLFRTTGPAFDASPWSPATPIPVGTMDIIVSNGNTATLRYTVDGVTVNKSIQRQVFATPATQCRNLN